MFLRCFRLRGDPRSSFRRLGTKGVAPADVALDVVTNFEPLPAQVVSLVHTVVFHPVRVGAPCMRRVDDVPALAALADLARDGAQR